jgi:hypothetical protein
MQDSSGSASGIGLGEYVIPATLAVGDPHARPELMAWRVAADEPRAAYAEWRRSREATPTPLIAPVPIARTRPRPR